MQFRKRWRNLPPPFRPPDTTTGSSTGPRRGMVRQRPGNFQGRGNSPPDGHSGASPGLLEGRRIASEGPPGRHPGASAPGALEALEGPAEASARPMEKPAATAVRHGLPLVATSLTVYRERPRPARRGFGVAELCRASVAAGAGDDAACRGERPVAENVRYRSASHIGLLLPGFRASAAEPISRRTRAEKADVAPSLRSCG